MRKRARAALRPPRADDRRLWDVMLGIWGYPAVLVADELKFFEMLAEKELALDEICKTRRIPARSAHAILAVCTSLGLMSLRNGRYALTPISREYMLPSSPYFFGWFYSAWRLVISVWTPDSLREAVLTGRPQGVFSDPGGVFASWHSRHAEDFTRAMHSASMAPAMVWPRKLDLSRARVMLDVGGGSGAHSIGAVTVRPKLRAIVLDQATICAIALESAEKYGVADRVSTHTADFFNDPYPPADLHFYSMIFHDSHARAMPVFRPQELRQSALGRANHRPRDALQRRSDRPVPGRRFQRRHADRDAGAAVFRPRIPRC